MMQVTSKEQGALVVADVLEIIGGKWRGLILAKLCDGPKRFNEMKLDLKKVTSSTLTKELRHLEELKMIERAVIQESPIIVEYRMTTHGSSIKQLIYQIIEWGLEHRKKVIGEK
ncbi:winged helix-turn-helix transcriptional regulator [Chryseobacterium aquaticum]|nr:helix-turn-helix domain-containing protein [Chryseobacterium aquaticum]